MVVSNDMRALLLFVLLLSASPVRAAPEGTADLPPQNSTTTFPDIIFSQSPADKAAMDINPDRFTDFWKKWHFVTVRWRQDIHEFRFIYANDLAWKTLSAHRTDYPVGAMFGKLIYPAEEDLALPSSVLASNILNRLEIMLWDPGDKKAAATGWVYLRFINRDPRTPQDKDSTGIWGVMSQKEVDSCVECHSRAYDRNNIFAQPLYLFRDRSAGPDITVEKVKSNRFGDSMKELASDAVPRIAYDLINSFPEWKGRKLKGYEGNFFSGALGEIGPVLTKLAQHDTGSIFMVYDRDDPDMIELASAITKKGYKNCAGTVRLRGSNLNRIPMPVVKQGRRLPQENAGAQPEEAQGVRVRDLSKEFKPSAELYTICGSDGISRENLPLLYKTEDKDGLPSYYFAPAVKN